MDQQAGQSFVKEKLNDLGQRQMDLQHGLAEVQQELDCLDREAVDTGLVRAALGQVKDLFGALKPYEQRELMQLVLQRAEVNEREITLEVYALTEDSLQEKVAAEGERSQAKRTTDKERHQRLELRCSGLRILPDTSQTSTPTDQAPRK